jgi:MoxR-like ATPase
LSEATFVLTPPQAHLDDALADAVASTDADDEAEARRRATAVRRLFALVHEQVSRAFVGQPGVVDGVIYALLTGGHVLIEGVPGLGKTLLVRTLADCLHVPMSRIQFTPDLMPADITGTTLLTEADTGGHELRFQPGPLISSLVLADEVNRATPKTQSALLEAMAEGQVTVAGRTLPLPDPFMVLATQNPLEQEGTYPLPEAQLDRFLLKLRVGYPTEDEMDRILERTTGAAHARADGHRFAAADVRAAREAVRAVPAVRRVRLHAIRLVAANHPDQPAAPPGVRRHVAAGAGPRAAQALLLLAKARGVVHGRFAASCEDVRAFALPVLRHRLMLTFGGVAERASPDALVAEVLDAVPAE